MLSSRAKLWESDPKDVSYGYSQIMSYGDVYDEQENPAGALCMAIAENKLVGEMLLSKLNEFHKQGGGYTQEACNYTAPSGLPAVKSSVAEFLSNFIFKGADRIVPDNIVLGSGCVAMLHQLAYLLFEVGDQVMVPTPYYPAFVKDFKALGNVDILDVGCSVDANDDLDLSLTAAALETAYNSGREGGKSVKALLLTHPANPTGRCYSSEELQIAASFCNSKEIHLIMDEIYANSVFVDNAFESFSTVLHQQNREGVQLISPDLVHTVWSMSKDFGGSGLRFGVCHTKNEMLLNAMNSMCDATMISNLAQQSIGYLLGDHQFCQTFIDNNKIMLRESYFALKGGLEGLGLKLVDAHSGIFALADLRGLLRIDKDSGKKESEESLEMRLRTHKIFLTPGRICKCPIPGFFRFCYAWTSLAGVKEAISRLAQEKNNKEDAEK